MEDTERARIEAELASREPCDWTTRTVHALLDALAAADAREADLARRLAASETEFMCFAVDQDVWNSAYMAICEKLDEANARIAALSSPTA